MRCFTIFLFALICSGCNSGQSPLPPAADFDGTSLTPEFSEQLYQLVDQPSEPFAGHGGLPVAARGTIVINDQNYDIYGNFTVCGSEMWTSHILEQFWNHLNDNVKSNGSKFVPDESEPEHKNPMYMDYPDAKNAE